MIELDQIQSLLTRANSLTGLQKYAEAIDALHEAIELAEDMGRLVVEAILYNFRGNVLERTGEVQDAVMAYHSGYMAWLSQTPDEAASWWRQWSRSPKSHERSRRLLTAMDLYQAVLSNDLIEAEQEPALPVMLLLNLGNSYLRQPQHDKARRAYLEALDRPELAEAPVLKAHLLTHLALCERHKKSTWDSALEHLDMALALLKAHAPRTERRRAIAAYASIHRLREETDAALAAYKTAVDLYRLAGDEQGEARVLVNFGHCYLQERRFAEAQVQYERAVKLATTFQDDETLWHAYWGLGNCQHAFGRLQDAARSIERSLNLIAERRQELETDEGKVTFLNSVQDVFEFLLRIQLDRAVAGDAGYERALAEAERSRGQALADLSTVHPPLLKDKKYADQAEDSARLRAILPGAELEVSQLGEILADPQWEEVLRRLEEYGDLFRMAVAV